MKIGAYMKKILMSFLMIAMIAGCVQAPTEVEKPKETEYTLDELVKIETTEVSVTDFQREIDDRWHFSYQLDKIQINLQSDEINQLNEQMAERYDKYVNELRYQDDTLREGHFMDASAFLNKEILSLVVRDQWFLFEAGLRPADYEIYNIDLETGHILSNEELLEYLNLNENNLFTIDNDKEREINELSELILKDNQLYTLEKVNLSEVKAITSRKMLLVYER